uniref:Uncharacterized protein n=2 Tax=Aplanochytrium stocchinoi TaxID=215587 RepID=A0A7S3LRR1_9STRA|mmetsp:Transcript_16980/g.21713  ORF Transcript_16980/g.21713 Transcript_16980/m.21713 type:complete len:375 (+) Transcript_16980:233-1357(+)|eukprot:CAMPEP_0204863096 /NCGR_PEP_ID=MMETSP1348-20121228/3053_1 /ASSEMBLY_ACC=CAM_ASM_000700 /TAXON_ID=215587 /ORGANISM="Aplanochytrium stocchinoi, Strain GSBS06" /LENGTH=374 /DNA_ID=CAMNT_0052013311 /DNA_START=147 /DNA_END=1271 /DNA_ORIENTATION=-
MNDSAPYTIYSPKEVSWERNETMPAEILQQKLYEFYMVFKPTAIEKGQLETYLKFARAKGVLALQRKIKGAYGCSLDEADVSEAGRYDYWLTLLDFYKKFAPGKSVKEIEPIYEYALKKGYDAVDQKLKQQYKYTLFQFKARPLNKWKKNWHNVLDQHHKMNLRYELKRFYAVQNRVDPKNFKTEHDIQRLVQWGMEYTRSAVNEQLLKNYQFCLDDVKMVKGNTDSEREVNLRKQLIEFYQIYDPQMLTAMSNKVPDTPRTPGVGIGYRTPENDEVSEGLQKIYDQVKVGIVELEALDEKLKDKYGAGLEDKFKEKLRIALTDFYARVDNKKDNEAIEKIIKYGLDRGLEAMGERLVLKYGEGIDLEEFDERV